MSRLPLDQVDAFVTAARLRNLTRAADARSLRPRVAPDRAPAAESPAERPRAAKNAAAPRPRSK